MNGCSVEGCVKIGRLRRGYCATHYSRWRVHGDPLALVRKTRVVLSIADLEDRSTKNDGGCWEWNGAINTSGYAWMFFDGRSRIASRVAWTLSKGEIPEGMMVLHRCDNRRCVNPDHLFLGTNAENMADMVSKGRSPRSRAKLSESSVKEMRAVSGLSLEELAERYSVSASTVYQATTRRTWKHI